MKYIGVSFSDLHMTNWKQFNADGRRLRQSIVVLDHVIKASVKYDCPILFKGDLLDHPRHADNVVLEIIAQNSKTLKKHKKKIYGINGNHDLIKINSFANPQRGYLHHLSDIGGPFVCLDFCYVDLPYYRLHGIPYINGNSDFMDALENSIQNLAKDKGNILMVHRDLVGAVEPDGRRVEKDDNDLPLRKALKKFSLVLSGHIHKPQQLPKLGKHVYMIGAPAHQRRSDFGCEMGYWLIRKDFTMKFVPLDLPQFKYHEYNEEPTNETDYWIRLPKRQENEMGNGQKNKEFMASQKRSDLIRSYLEVKGIKNKTRFNLLMDLIND